ncbi:hypothetical protein P7C70_g1437, partial [Phenoliferia sp. Uapishka_3]
MLTNQESARVSTASPTPAIVSLVCAVATEVDGMDQDLLRLVPTSRALLVLDTLLAALTSKSTFKRRGSYFMLVLSFYLAYSIISPFSKPRHTLSPRSLLDREDAAAASYSPRPPTPEQQLAHSHLTALSESRQSVYPPGIFHERELASDTSHVVGVTAVVLHWKRRQGLQLVLEHISKYPYIREIIIWNNMPGVNLVASDFVLSSRFQYSIGPPKLRIINSPSNVHDAGKHIACSLASYKHCYFNDDDWLNIYMDSLYTNYLDCCAGGGGPERGGSGGRIASNTMPLIHLEHRRWRFANSDVDLHTGFTWLGTGSFAPRHLSTRFMNQQSAAPELLTREQTLVSDMFFSLWANSYPEQMPNDLVPIDIEGEEVGWSRGEGVDQWRVVYTNILDATRKLYDILVSEDPHLCPDPFPVAAPPPESHNRAPCANDGCLFTTSLTPFPPPSALTFAFEDPPKPFWSPGQWFKTGKAASKSIVPSGLTLTDMEGKLDPWRLTSMGEYEDIWGEVEGGFPTDDWWVEKGSWHLAVDGKGSDTCWESWRPPDEQDHFGLTLVAPRVIQEIKITGSLDLEQVVAWENTGAGPEAWELYTVRADGSGAWESRRLRSLPGVTLLGPSRIEVSLALEPLLDFYGKDAVIRKIKFVSRGKKRTKLSICSFGLDGWRI